MLQRGCRGNNGDGKGANKQFVEGGDDSKLWNSSSLSTRSEKQGINFFTIVS